MAKKKKKRKEVVWTKRCQDGRACSWKASREAGMLKKAEAAWKGVTGRDDYKESHAPSFIPNNVDYCDACLMRKYKLESRPDSCDQMGFGPNYVEEDEVIAALRKAEDHTKRVRAYWRSKAKVNP